MQIRFHANFKKRFKKLSPSFREKTLFAIKKFEENPFDHTLKNHPLRGKLEDKRAFSVSGDMRIIFEEYENHLLVLVLDIGTHNPVYKS